MFCQGTRSHKARLGQHQCTGSPISGLSSWVWGAVYRVVLGFCVGATTTAILSYQSREGDRACVALSGTPKDIRISLCFKAIISAFQPVLHVQARKRGGWYVSWGSSLLPLPHRLVRGYRKHIFIDVSLLKKKSKISKRLMKGDHLKWHSFPLDALWDPSQSLLISASSWQTSFSTSL